MGGTMTTEQALLAGILAAPDDDLPRLVFADWCDENGQGERGEFIRIQISREQTMRRLVAAGVKDVRLMQAGDRERKLLGKFIIGTNIYESEAAWLGDNSLLLYGQEIAGGGWLRAIDAMWSRGFISRITLPLSAFTEDVARTIFSTQPVTAVVFAEANAAFGEIGWVCDSEEEIYNRDERFDIIPRGLFYRLGSGSPQSDSVEWMRYTDAATALNDLQQAAVSWGRELAGLPPLPRNDTAAGCSPAAGRHDGPAA